MDTTLKKHKNKLIILSECYNLEILLKSKKNAGNIAKLLERDINRAW